MNTAAPLVATVLTEVTQHEGPRVNLSRAESARLRVRCVEACADYARARCSPEHKMRDGRGPS